MDFKVLKQNARKSLEGKWGETLVVLLLFGIITAAAGTVDMSLGKAIFGSSEINGIEYNTSLSIITLVVSCLIGLGYTSYFLKVSRGETPTFKELFSKTNLFVPFFLLSLLMGIFVTLWSLLLIVPGIIAGLSYSQASKIMLDNEKMDAMECLRKSKELMKGHKWEFFKLELSFIGWMLLGLLTCGILYFWLTPYMTVTECNYYNELIKKKK